MAERYQYPNCWIRGSMNDADIEGDVVRQITQKCPYRKAQGWSLFGGADHVCTHSAIQTKEEVEGAKEKYGGIMAGGSVDDFATFCEAVDTHLTSLGEKSRLAIEGVARDVHPLLKSGK